jgi:anti-anti-sigma factor
LEATPRSAPRADLQRPRVKVELEARGYAAIVSLHGEHDLTTGEAVRAALMPRRGSVLVDLTRCDFIDSTIIGVLLTRARQLVADGDHVELLLPPPHSVVARALEIVNVRDVVAVHDQPLSLFAEGPTELDA